MSRYHDKWYSRLFSDPRIVEELLRSFVHEDFVQELDFSSIKKLNTKFIPVSEKSRHRELVKIRNAVSTVFYIENSSVEDIEKNRKELITLLKAVMKKDGSSIVNAIIQRIISLQDLPATSKTIKTIEDLTEVMSMWEMNVKKWEAEVLERGIEKGIAQTQFDIAIKMIRKGMSNTDISIITGIPTEKIVQIRKKLK